MKLIRKILTFLKSPKFIKFFIAGFAAFLVDTLVLNLIKHYIFTSQSDQLILSLISIPKLISSVFGMIASFFLNKYWAFKDKSNEMFSQASKFFGVFAMNVVLAAIVFNIYEKLFLNISLIEKVDSFIPTLANITTTGTIMFISYFFYSKFIFNGTKSTK